jgi:hypothetical protein
MPIPKPKSIPWV